MATLNTLWARALVQELVRGGVAHAVVSPGSRSAPLALACAEAAPGLRTWSILDERSAGFFALGLALASGRPAAVVVTSGTAGAHLLPAVIEAWAAGVPLIILTADRPWELHGFGAPQTIPQEGLYGRFTGGTELLAVAEANSESFLHLRATVARAVSACRRPPRGPVHLNVPFREPLAPDAAAQEPAGLSQLALHGRDGPMLASPAPVRRPPEQVLAATRRRLAATERGLVVIGPRAPSASLSGAVRALAGSHGYPLIADAASNARWGAGPRAVAHADLLVRSDALARTMRPELVIRIGGGLTSKRLAQWLDASGAETLLLSEDGRAVDPSHAAALLLEGSLEETCAALTGPEAPRRTPWADAFRAADARVAAALEAAFAEGTLSEPQLAHRLLAGLPEGGCLVVASSMPIRDVDAFTPAGSAEIRVFANRGVNGIDGTVSTALGVAAATGAPTAVLLGDLALLHDLGGLVAARGLGVPLTLVVANNDGGGIFSFLPIASAGASFERLFAMPQGVDLAAAGALGGARFTRVTDAAQLSRALELGRTGGLHLIEAMVPDRAANVELHRALADRAARAAEAAP